MIDTKDYADFVRSTAKMESTDTNYFLVGFAGEAGEVLDQWKKVLRDGNGVTPEHRAKLIDELGDVMWYFHAACASIGTTAEMVMERNMQKLTARRAAEGEARVANK